MNKRQASRLFFALIGTGLIGTHEPIVALRLGKNFATSSSTRTTGLAIKKFTMQALEHHTFATAATLLVIGTAVGIILAMKNRRTIQLSAAEPPKKSSQPSTATTIPTSPLPTEPTDTTSTAKPTTPGTTTDALPETSTQQPSTQDIFSTRTDQETTRPIIRTSEQPTPTDNSPTQTDTTITHKNTPISEINPKTTTQNMETKQTPPGITEQLMTTSRAIPSTFVANRSTADNEKVSSEGDNDSGDSDTSTFEIHYSEYAPPLLVTLKNDTVLSVLDAPDQNSLSLNNNSGGSYSQASLNSRACDTYTVSATEGPVRVYKDIEEGKNFLPFATILIKHIPQHFSRASAWPAKIETQEAQSLINKNRMTRVHDREGAPLGFITTIPDGHGQKSYWFVVPVPVQITSPQTLKSIDGFGEIKAVFNAEQNTSSSTEGGGFSSGASVTPAPAPSSHPQPAIRQAPAPTPPTQATGVPVTSTSTSTSTRPPVPAVLAPSLLLRTAQAQVPQLQQQ